MAVPEIAADLGRRFDYVLVDEYQDTNAIQAAILQRLKPDGRGVTVVGDDAQAIYAFRAATVRNILDFPHRFAPPAGMVTLEQELPLDPADPGRRQRGDRARAPRATARSCSRPAARRSCRGWSWSATTSPRPSTSRPRCWPTARPGWPCATRRSCSAPPATAPPSSWSWRGATSPTSSSAACGSSRQRTSRTCWRCCAGPRTRATRWRPSGCCSSCPASARRSHAEPWTRSPASWRSLAGIRPPAGGRGALAAAGRS